MPCVLGGRAGTDPKTSAATPAATLDAVPDDDPPTLIAGFRGFRQGPCAGEWPLKPTASSHMSARATTMAPASTNLETQGALDGGRHSFRAAVEAVVSAPLTSMFTFTTIGSPSSSPSGCLFLTLSSTVRAASSALSARVSTQAFRGRSLVSRSAMRSSSAMRAGGSGGGPLACTFVEVKTSRYYDHNVFDLSYFEWDFLSREPPVQYRIYRVSGAAEAAGPRVSVIHDVLRAVKEGSARLCLAI